MGLPLRFIPCRLLSLSPVVILLSGRTAWTTKFFCEGRLSREIISPYYPLPPDWNKLLPLLARSHALTRPMSPEQANYFCNPLWGGKRGD